MATSIGIMAHIGMDGRGFHAGLMSAEKAANRFARRVSGYLAGMFTIGAAVRFTRGLIENADKIKDMSNALGMSAERFQELDYIAKQTGTSVEAIAKSLVFISKAQDAALKGGPTSEMAKAFADLGFSFEQLRQPAGDIADKISEGAENGTIGFHKMASLSKVLGRSAREVLAAYQAGFKTMGKQARDAGLIISDETIEQVSAYDDALTKAMVSITAFATEALPVIKDVAVSIKDVFVALYAYLSSFAEEYVRQVPGKPSKFPLAWPKIGGHPAGEEVEPLMDRIKRSNEKGIQAFEAVAAAISEREADAKTERIVAAGIRAQRLAMQQELQREQVETIIPKPTTAKDFQVPTDELAKIGGFIGGTGSARMQIEKEQLQTQKGIQHGVQELNRKFDGGL